MTVLEVARGSNGRLRVAVETTEALVGCELCGTRAVVKDRPRVGLADLPAFGSPVTLMWHKRRWSCPERACEKGSWTEDRPDIAPVRAAMTTRAGLWATREVGAEIHTVAYAAGQLGVAWHTVMDAVTYWGRTLIDDPDRVGTVAALGVDETKFLAAQRFEATQWISSICDVARRVVIDVIEGRQRAELTKWLDTQPRWWLDAVTSTVTDLHEPFRKALASRLPNATAVADPFHVVGVANRVLDKTRRAVQTNTLGHRGRSGDPLYRARKLLAMGAERIDAGGDARLAALLAEGDPDGHVYEAWITKETVRDLYTMWGHRDLAATWLDAIIAGCRAGRSEHVKGLARTLTQWRAPIIAWHTHGHSNGPVEGLNSLIKKVKRVAAGFRNFNHYRTRILLACGGCNWDLLGTHTPLKREAPP